MSDSKAPRPAPPDEAKRDAPPRPQGARRGESNVGTGTPLLKPLPPSSGRAGAKKG